MRPAAQEPTSGHWWFGGEGRGFAPAWRGSVQETTAYRLPAHNRQAHIIAIDRIRPYWLHPHVPWPAGLRSHRGAAGAGSWARHNPGLHSIRPNGSPSSSRIVDPQQPDSKPIPPSSATNNSGRPPVPAAIMSLPSKALLFGTEYARHVYWRVMLMLSADALCRPPLCWTYAIVVTNGKLDSSARSWPSWMGANRAFSPQGGYRIGGYGAKREAPEWFRRSNN